MKSEAVFFDQIDLTCRFRFQVDFLDSQRLSHVKSLIEVTSDFELVQVSHDYSFQTIASRLVEELAAKRGRAYAFRSRSRLIIDTFFNPSIWLNSLTRSFLITVNQSAGRATHSKMPLLNQFRFNENLDFWCRASASKSSDLKDPRLNAVSFSLETSRERMQNPIMQLVNTNFRSFLDFLALSNNLSYAKSLAIPFSNTIFSQALELIIGGKTPEDAGMRLSQRIQKDSDVDLYPLYSHQDFCTDRIHVLNNVEIWHERFVVSGKYVICRENAADLRSDWPAGLWMYKWAHPSFNDGVLVSRPLETNRAVDEAIAGFGRCDTNWFHFIIETLPRILNASEFAAKQIPILVQSDIPASALDAISATTAREIIKIGGEHLRVSTLYVPQTRSITMDSAFLENVTGDFSASSLFNLRDKLLSAFPPEKGGAKKIVLLRQGLYRRIKNIKKVLSVLENYGFKFIDIGSLPLKEQINVIHNAEVIVSQGGAAVTNMLFANNEAKFIGLIGPAKNQYLLWENFLNCLNLENSFIIGHHVGKKDQVFVHSDFVVSIAELETTLRQL